MNGNYQDNPPAVLMMNGNYQDDAYASLVAHTNISFDKLATKMSKKRTFEDANLLTTTLSSAHVPEISLPILHPEINVIEADMDIPESGWLLLFGYDFEDNDIQLVEYQQSTGPIRFLITDEYYLFPKDTRMEVISRTNPEKTYMIHFPCCMFPSLLSDTVDQWTSRIKHWTSTERRVYREWYSTIHTPNPNAWSENMQRILLDRMFEDKTLIEKITTDVDLKTRLLDSLKSVWETHAETLRKELKENMKESKQSIWNQLELAVIEFRDKDGGLWKGHYASHTTSAATSEENEKGDSDA